MDKIILTGGSKLSGKIDISGAKNAALPLMATTLLTNEKMFLENIPRLGDVGSMRELLEGVGVEIEDLTTSTASLGLKCERITNTEAPYDIVRKMRASILVLGPLIARSGKARVSLPGGCAIGNRPVDLHLNALMQMGAQIDLSRGYVEAKVTRGNRLQGSRINFPMVSVGATENIMLAASLADGETELSNVAREPEIVNLAECLIKMGAEIEGHGTDTIRIQGKESLRGTTHSVIADRIEAGTFAIAACITGGKLELVGANFSDLRAVLDVLLASGARIEENSSGILVEGPNGSPCAVDIMTDPYPGFPTDLQAQVMAYMTRVDGASMITETIFENRFMHVPELNRMGANINVHNSTALIRGVNKLMGAPVMATDLRASVSLVLAGLAASGETTINRIYHLDRGYESLVSKLKSCGAIIDRVRT
mgnify:FL=1